MKSPFSPLLFTCIFLLVMCAAAEVHYHDFVVQATPVRRLCKTRTIITVNGQFPGPTLVVRNGDTLVVKVTNHAKYNATIHWHGVRQLRTGWADGPAYVTQCPIRPGGTYTYRFTITDQEGTLWWHAHTSWLRATVYGALIVYPRQGATYPFPKPDKETPIIVGEWWNADPIKVVTQAMKTGAAANVSDAFTINGQPGDLYNCSAQGTTVIPVTSGETNLLRFINAAINTEHFITVASHTMTVVAVDSAYTKPFTTSVIMLGPGQTTDVLVTTNQPARRYYIAARAYAPARGIVFDNTTTTALLAYNSKGVAPPRRVQFPRLPAYNNTATATATAFAAGLKSLAPKIPGPVDTNIFFTIGFGLFNCSPNQQCGGPNNTRLTSSMNNISFILPSKLSLLQAYFLDVPRVFTADFPEVPPKEFDYTANNISRSLWQPFRATKVSPLKFGTVVQLVLQDTNILAADSHPMHIHGFQFYILATGFGNYDEVRDAGKFNLVDPPERNTVIVPVNGWAVIRFKADNPGVWLMHCHLDVHLNWGLATNFVVENGVGELETLEPPPADLPSC